MFQTSVVTEDNMLECEKIYNSSDPHQSMVQKRKSNSVWKAYKNKTNKKLNNEWICMRKKKEN